MVTTYEAALKLVPEPAPGVRLPEVFLEHFRRGNELYEAGDFAGALREYDAALALGPDDPATLNNRGVALAGLRRYEEALADLSRSLALRPDDPDTFYNRGIVLMHLGLGRYQEALADYNRALELRPGDPDTLCNRGAALAGLGHYAEALADIDRALALGVEHELARDLRAAVLKKLLGRLVTGGKEAWLGGKPIGAKEPLILKPGAPTVSQAVIEDRR